MGSLEDKQDIPAANEAEHDCWDTAQVSPEALNSKSRFIFGYGSLIWKVDFPTTSSFPCLIHGFLRRFWMKSADHRGTPEFPGRVCTLIKGQDADTVSGMCYEIPEEGFADIMKDLDYRERHGYTRTVGEVVDLDGKKQEVQVYYCHGSNAIVWDEDASETAKIIEQAVGPSGPNVVYLRNLAQANDKLGFGADLYLKDLVEKVEANIQAAE